MIIFRKRKSESGDHCSDIKRQKLDSVSRISFDDTIDVGLKQQEEEETSSDTARFVRGMRVVSLTISIQTRDLPSTL